jgi:hypothetical protein
MIGVLWTSCVLALIWPCVVIATSILRFFTGVGWRRGLSMVKANGVGAEVPVETGV